MSGRWPECNAPFRQARECACGDHGFVGLTKGGTALFDVDALAVVSGRLWVSKRGYARRTEYRGAARTQAWMHREVIDVGDDESVDHISGDRSDNRSANLRACTHSQNLRNQGAVYGKQKFKGVSFHIRDQAFYARITADRKTVHIGKFFTPEDAARAYDRAAIELHGEFARTNASLGLLTPTPIQGVEG